MRDLTKEEEVELLEVWDLIKTGRAINLNSKSRAIALWNSISGTTFKTNTNCQGCLGTVFYGMEKLHKEYLENKE